MSIIKLAGLKLENKEAKTAHLDINNNFAQYFGQYKNSVEDLLYNYVSSATVATGGHAGDPQTILNTLQKVKSYNLSLGAHISYPDMLGFGNRDMNLSFDELKATILYQLGALQALAKTFSIEFEYVKPHGALYNKLVKDKQTAIDLVNAIKMYDPWVIIVFPHSNIANEVAEITSTKIVQEFVIGKSYDAQGNVILGDSTQNKEMEINKITEQIENFVSEAKIVTTNGNLIQSEAKTMFIPHEISDVVEIAQRTYKIVGKPVPIPVTLVADSGWI